MLGYAGALCRRACLMLRDFVTLRGRPPRAPNLIAGLLIDDLILLDFVRKELPREPFFTQEIRAGRWVLPAWASERLVEQVVR